MYLVPFRCYRLTRPVTDDELLRALEARLSDGVLRLNQCSQECLWVRKQTVVLLLVRLDDYFAWVPLSQESTVYSAQQD